MNKAALSPHEIDRYAEMFGAIGAVPRLRIMRLLLSTHPNGMVVSDIQNETGIPGSTLSHHLDKLRIQDLITVRREGTFLWYSVQIESLVNLLRFLYAECCTRNRVIEPETLVNIAK